MFRQATHTLFTSYASVLFSSSSSPIVFVYDASSLFFFSPFLLLLLPGEWSKKTFDAAFRELSDEHPDWLDMGWDYKTAKTYGALGKGITDSVRMALLCYMSMDGRKGKYMLEAVRSYPAFNCTFISLISLISFIHSFIHFMFDKSFHWATEATEGISVVGRFSCRAL